MTISGPDEKAIDKPPTANTLHVGGAFRSPDRIVAVVGILATLLGSLVGSLVGAKISADAALGAVETQISATAVREHRDKVSQVYSDYLKAVDAYVSASDFLKNPGMVETVPVPAATEGVGLNVSQDAYGRYENARSSLQGRATDLFAFGSENAWKAHLTLFATLPKLFAPGEPPAEGLKYDVKVYEEAYLGFVRIYCREVASDPQATCGDL